MSNGSIKIWLLASRPKTLWAALAPVLIGTALAYKAGGFHLWSALAAAFSATMIQIGTNLANDYFDFKSGVDSTERLGPTRATQAGLVSPEVMKRAFIIAFALAFVAGVYLVVRGGWPIVAIGLLSILFGILYTAGPYPLAYTGLADPFVFVFFGPVAVGGTFYVQTLTIDPSVIIAGLAPGLFSTAILTVNNLRDIKTDRSSGRKTLAVRFGAAFARTEYLICLLLVAATPFVLVCWYDAPKYLLISAAILPIAVPTIRKIYTLEASPEFNELLAATGKLLMLYAVLFSVGWLL